VPTYSTLSRLAALALILLTGAVASHGQVRVIAVGSFGTSPAAQKMREVLVSELRKRGDTVASSAAGASMIMNGKVDIWLRGYYSLNPRSRSITGDAHAVYGGYLSVEVRGPQNEPVWSYLVTPHRTGSDEIYRNLAEQVVKRFREAVK
jgi:hypothetical protein